MKQFDFDELLRVNHEALSCSATIRVLPEHFFVEELLPFIPDGQGGHVFLKIEKRGINTDWLAMALAKFSGVAPVAIGYAGLKDRHAVTRQWFSINLEGHIEPDWALFETDDIQIIEQTRHGKKLKRGVLSGNTFKLRLTDMLGSEESWLSSLHKIQQHGVPNYFGEQRFGHNGNNLKKVDFWFNGGKAPRKRNQKSMYLSAARSWLFNLILSERITQGNWDTALTGDSMLLVGTKSSLFSVSTIDHTLEQRLLTMDVHPTGSMWGRGQALNSKHSYELEQAVLACWDDWKLGLEKAGLSQERRALRLFPNNLSWQFTDDKQLDLTFFLPAGSYATAVLRELGIIIDNQHKQRPLPVQTSLTID